MLNGFGIPWRKIYWQIKLILLVVCCALFLPTDGSRASGKQFDEYQVKAAFLYNLTNFVSWPALASDTARTPFVITILGEDPFGPVLDKIVAGERVSVSPIEVRRLQRLEDLTPCHILFVSEAVAAYDGVMPRLVAFANENKVLTVADFPQFVHQGGAVALVFRNNRVNIDINIDAASYAGLQFSSKLLQVATVIGREGPQ